MPSLRSTALETLPIDPAGGIMVAGHSTGGEATLFANAYGGPAYGITSCALHHYGSGGGYVIGPYVPPPSQSAVPPYGPAAAMPPYTGPQKPPLPTVRVRRACCLAHGRADSAARHLATSPVQRGCHRNLQPLAAARCLRSC